MRAVRGLRRLLRRDSQSRRRCAGGRTWWSSAAATRPARPPSSSPARSARCTSWSAATDLYKDMSSYLARRIEETPNIEVLLNTEVRRMLGESYLSEVEIVNKKTGEVRTIKTPALFSFIGAVPRTDWLPPEIERDAKGFVRTGSGSGAVSPLDCPAAAVPAGDQPARRVRRRRRAVRLGQARRLGRRRGRDGGPVRARVLEGEVTPDTEPGTASSSPSSHQSIASLHVSAAYRSLSFRHRGGTHEPGANETSVGSRVIAVYPDHASAEAAVRRLLKEGFDMKEVSIVGRDFQMTEEPIGFLSTGDFAAMGAGTGAWVGGLFGLLVGAAFLVLPGVGPVIVAGPLSAALLGGLEGALAGAALGALSGALVGLGVPKKQRSNMRPRSRPASSSSSRGTPEKIDRAKTLLTTGKHEEVGVYEATPA